MKSKPAPINSQQYWEERFQASWNEHKGGEQTRFFAEVLVGHLPDWFRRDFVEHRMSLCDWGCAEGEAVGYLGEIFPGNEIRGVDFARSAVKHAGQKFPNHRFIAEDWIGAEGLKADHDVVLASNILEHFSQPLGVLRDVLGRKAKKYIMLLIPFDEQPDDMDPEHFFRFVKNNIPLSWGDWFCMYFEIVDTAAMKLSRWRGQQAVVIYARKDWIEKTGLEFSLTNYPSEIPVLAWRLDQAGDQLKTGKVERELADKKLENQLIHDKVLLDSNNRLQAYAEGLKEEQKKYLNQLKDSEVARARDAAELQGLRARQAEAAQREQSWMNYKEAYEKLTEAINLKQEHQESLVRHWREAAEARETKNEALLRDIESLQSDMNQLRRERDEIAMRHQVCRFPAENEQLTTERDRLVEQAQKLRQTQEEFVQQSESMRRELEALRLDRQKLATRAETQQEELEALRLERQKLNTHAETLRDELEALRLERQKLTTRAETMQEELEALRLDRQKQTTHAETLRDELEAFRLERQKLTTRAETMQEELEALRLERQKLNTHAETLREELEALRIDKQELTTHTETLRDELANVRLDKQKLTTHTETLQDELANVRRAREQMDIEINAVRGQLEELRQEREQARANLGQERAAQEKRIAELALQNENLAGENEKLAGEQTRLKEAVARIGPLESANRDLSEKNERLQKNMRAVETSNQKLQAQVAAEAGRNEQLRIQQQEKNGELANKILQMQAQNLGLGNEVARLREESRELGQIKSMYYYRWARKIDVVKGILGLRRRRKPAAGPNAAGSSNALSGAGAKALDDSLLDEPIRVETNDEDEAPLQAITAKPLKDIVAGSIMDVFTESCFGHECHLLPFSPENWKSVLEEFPIDFLFVESAWKGNKGAWNYRIGSYPGCPGRELEDVIKWCWVHGIPTVFWNKEDPPHFDKFVETAGKFDFVFTTDANCIPRYKERLGHDRILPLPFAAQPAIHNPVLTKPRDGNVCFAGTYYADDFEERRRDMDVLLFGSKPFGLDIYDRCHGYQGHDRERFLFPGKFQENIRGKLEYEQMVEAYRAYKVFVNVNSVYDSPTMFSRRVFELLACGTPVVSTRSLGIKLFFGELVAQVASIEDVTAALDRLLKHPGEWWRASAHGIRSVMSQHTYTHRLKTIVDTIGLKALDGETAPPAVVVIPGSNPRRLAECIVKQSLAPASVFVVMTGAGEKAAPHAEALKGVGIKATVLAPDALAQHLHRRLAAGAVAFMDSSHYYGPNYLSDAAMALSYCGSPITGLSAYFTASSVTAARVDETAGEEYFKRERVFGPTVVAHGGRVSDAMLGSILRGEWVQAGAECYGRSRFEFLHACPDGAEPQLLRQVCL